MIERRIEKLRHDIASLRQTRARLTISDGSERVVPYGRIIAVMRELHEEGDVQRITKVRAVDGTRPPLIRLLDPSNGTD